MSFLPYFTKVRIKWLAVTSDFFPEAPLKLHDSPHLNGLLGVTHMALRLTIQTARLNHAEGRLAGRQTGKQSGFFTSLYEFGNSAKIARSVVKHRDR